ncbi:winged helix-turn-helix transcriptional regulator [Halanaerobiaceae bacterium Z-7014]|uniref:Winged helix-turn-helix transcriptional regulator n=1 Tax=Halonatronomonas betaini TaxID=2778430 RepID=A0A931AYJ9_9FIRM|nr:metalloregulator ArsR/SmtB family transcription factor [Halonatronomonas betaini]MBF8437168.1 winged helix-turn-helix transcriptional regulator [Halonatronomonas betaini]
MASDLKEKSESCLTCEVFNPHEMIIELLKKKELDEDVYQRLSDIFKALSDPTRLKIINALRVKELCVCDIQEAVGLSTSAVSHQLRILRNLDLVKYRKEGRQAIYSLADEHVLALFSQGLEHVLESIPEKK